MAADKDAPQKSNVMSHSRWAMGGQLVGYFHIIETSNGQHVLSFCDSTYTVADTTAWETAVTDSMEEKTPMDFVPLWPSKYWEF